MYKKNLVFAAACLGMLLFGIVFLSLGSVVNMLAHRFSLDYNHIGTLTVLLPGGILAGSLIFGPIVDHFGYKWLLILCSLMVLVALEGIAFANEKIWVQFFILLIGFGGGMLNGATNALVADVSAGERGAKLSLLGVFFGIGALGMPGLLGALSKHFSPESIVAGIGLFVILPVIYFLVIHYPPPKQAQGASMRGSFALLKEPMLLSMGLILAIQSGMEGMSNDWMTRYFSKVLQATDQHSLYALTALVAAMTATRLLLGGLLKKISAQFILFSSIIFSASGALVLMSGTNYWVAVLGVILIGIGLSAGFPVMLGYIGDLYSSKSGTAFSIVFVIALTGNMTINKLMGRIAQEFGIAQYAKVMLGCLTFSAFLLFLVLKQFNKNNPQLTKQNEQRRETVA
ncbi:MAG: MFS transporter [Verrucomicrobiota bacterium]